MKTILITIGVTIGILIVLLAIFLIFVSVSVDFVQTGVNCPAPIPLNADEMRIGQDGFGYVTIPSSWQKLSDASSGTIQYGNERNWIVTLGTAEAEKVDAESYASLVEKKLQAASPNNCTRTQERLNNYNAYKLSINIPDAKKYMVAWTFEAEDGNTHYVAIEGPENNGNEYSIIQTFGVCK